MWSEVGLLFVLGYFQENTKQISIMWTEGFFSETKSREVSERP